MKILGFLGALLRRRDVDPQALSAKQTLAGALDIEYRDAFGRKTERYIEAKSLIRKGDRLYLWGWCELRQQMRSFRVDRIQALADGETGEVVDRERVASWLKRRAVSGR